jgi:hypothetical protein
MNNLVENATDSAWRHPIKIDFDTFSHIHKSICRKKVCIFKNNKMKHKYCIFCLISDLPECAVFGTRYKRRF